MGKTKIEYLDRSWNPIAMRCTPVSEGCANCWHRVMANRLRGNTAFRFNVRRAYAGEGPPVLIKKRLEEPLHRKKPTRFGVQFMGDLFHENVPSSFIFRVWQKMFPSGRHTFQILTKRPERMLKFIQSLEVHPGPHYIGLPNVWLGVSVENQATADERREYLRQTPAAVKFVSYEPALGPVDWTGWEFINQIISGGESGSGARPSHLDWHRNTRDFCQKNDIAYFFKQHGAWKPIEETIKKLQEWADKPLSSKFCWLHREYGQPAVGGPYADPGWQMFERVGKKRAGRLLDGVLWEEYPKCHRD